MLSKISQQKRLCYSRIPLTYAKDLSANWVGTSKAPISWLSHMPFPGSNKPLIRWELVPMFGICKIPTPLKFRLIHPPLLLTYHIITNLLTLLVPVALMVLSECGIPEPVLILSPWHTLKDHTVIQSLISNGLWQKLVMNVYQCQLMVLHIFGIPENSKKKELSL